MNGTYKVNMLSFMQTLKDDKKLKGRVLDCHLSHPKRWRMNNLCADVQLKVWKCAPVLSCLTLYMHA